MDFGKFAELMLDDENEKADDFPQWLGLCL